MIVVRKTEIHDFISSLATELRKKNRSNICFIIFFLTLKFARGRICLQQKKHFLFRKLINFISKHISQKFSHGTNVCSLNRLRKQVSCFVSLKYELTQRNLNLYIKLACTNFLSLSVRCFPEFSDLLSDKIILQLLCFELPH